MSGTASRCDRLLGKRLCLALASQPKRTRFLFEFLPQERLSATAQPALASMCSGPSGCAAQHNEQVLAAAGCATAGVAFQARAVAHQSEIAAFAAGLALVALGLGLGAFLCRKHSCACARQDDRLLLELLGGREFLLGLGLERRAAGDFCARLAAGKGGDFAAGSATRATLPPADGGG